MFLNNIDKSTFSYDKKKIYNNNITNLLDTNQMDLEMFEALTSKELITDENKLKIAKLIAKQDQEAARCLVDEVCKNSYYTYRRETRVVRRIILEQERYNNLSDDKKDYFDNVLDMGRYCLSIEDYENAYDLFTAGLYVTNHPLFEYYLGKLFYKIKDFKSAEKHLKKYLKIDGEKTTKAMLYLGRLYDLQGKFDMAYYHYDTANEIEKVLGNNNHFVIAYHKHKKRK